MFFIVLQVVQNISFSPNIKDVSCSNCRDVDIIAGLVEEHLEIADDSIGSLPALSHSTWSGDLDPTLTGRTKTMVNVNTKGKLCCRRVNVHTSTVKLMIMTLLQIALFYLAIIQV